MKPDIESLKSQLLQLRELHEAGTISTEHYEAGRQTAERALVDAVLQSSASPGPGDTAIPPERSPAASPSASSRMPAWALAALVLGVVVLAAAGYAWRGTPRLLSGNAAAAPPAAQPAAGGSENAHPMESAQMQAMVEKLRQRLDGEPGNAEGWGMLARSYTVLGKVDDALMAYEKAAGLKPDDAALLADFADTLALSQGRSLAGKPEELVQRALRADPDQPKALALAGTLAFDRKDYPGALRHWERALRVAPEHPLAAGLRGGVEEARRLSGLPAEVPASGAAAAKATNAPPSAAAIAAAAATSAGSAGITGTIALAPELAAKVASGDTLFIFARPAEGSRMPVAATRRTVGEWPVRFALDDSMSMTAQARLSQAGQVVVGVRISKAGQVAPQPGDLQGFSSPVRAGAQGVTVTVNQVVASTTAKP